MDNIKLIRKEMASSFGTSGLSIISALAFAAAAVLSTIASDRLRSLTGYNSNDTFKAANNNLTVSTILAWIATGLSFLLMVGYFFHAIELLQTEWLHAVLLVLGIASGLVSFIYLGLAMRKVDNTPNDNGIQNYILWAMIAAGVGVVILVFMALWRITHHATKPPKIQGTDSSGNAILLQQQPQQPQSQAPNTPPEYPVPAYLSGI